VAFTERYVTTTGSALNGGTNDTTDAWDFVTGWQSVGAGIRLNIKGGSYSVSYGGSINTLATATLASPAWIRGYVSTPGDLTYSRDSTGRLVTTGMPLISLAAGDRVLTGSYTMVEGLSITGNRSNELFYVGGYASVFNVRSENTYNLGFSSSSAFSCSDFSITLVGCDAIKSGTDTANGIVANTGTAIIGCRVTGNAGPAIYAASGYFSVVDSVLYTSTIGILVGGMSFGHNPCIVNNTIYNCSTAAIDMPNTGNMAFSCVAIVGNHITDCGRLINNNYGSVCGNSLVRNRTRDITSASTNVGDWPSNAAITTDNGGAETDYLDAATANFVLAQRAVARSQAVAPNRDIGGLDSPKYRDIGGTQASRDYGFRYG
jgi:hypothetical protein